MGKEAKNLMVDGEALTAIGGVALLAMFPIIFVGFVGFMVWDGSGRHTDVNSTFFNLYDADFPYGRFWVDTEGRFFFASGRITSELTESYSVKFWSNDELHSLILTATDTPIIVDGTFQLEVISTTLKFRITVYETKTSYKIHVPYLPPANVTMP